jgi:hypothetical protein
LYKKIPKLNVEPQLMTPTDTVPAEKYAEEEARAFANHGCVRASTERYVCNGYILFIFF